MISLRKKKQYKLMKLMVEKNEYGTQNRICVYKAPQKICQDGTCQQLIQKNQQKIFFVACLSLIVFLIIVCLPRSHYFGPDLPYLNSFEYGFYQQQQRLIRSMKFWTLSRQFNIQNNQTLEKFASQEIQYYQTKYQLSKYEQIQICVLSFNHNNVNQNRYLYNLNSIIKQNYSNFHLYYIDDYSTDGNAQLIEQYMLKYNVSDKMTFIKNEKNLGKAYNIWTVANKYCKPGSIMIQIDGDDELIGRQVFKHLSMLYQTTGAYFIFSNQLITTKNSKQIFTFAWKMNPKRINSQNSRYIGTPNHLHSYATDLFLDLKIQSFQLDGKFIMVSEDVSGMFSIIQKAGSKIFHTTQINYHYNAMTGTNDGERFGVNIQKEVAERLKKQVPKIQPYIKQIKFNTKPGKTI